MTTPNAERLADTRPGPASDEISLRELYLVLKRRSPWIVLAALVVALAAFLYASTRPPRYVAEGTTVVARAPIEVDVGTNLRFRPEVTVGFDTYQTLAFSRAVLEAVVPHHEASDVATLRLALTLERVAGTATQPATFLAVSHAVRSRDAGAAAASAEAWVEATVATVRALMLENLDVLEVITSDALERARARVTAAEEALEALRASTAPDALSLTITSTDEAIVSLEELLRSIERASAGLVAERDVLAELGVDDPMAIVLSSAPEVVLDVAGARASLTAQIAGLARERSRAVEQLAQLVDERAVVAQRRAEATVQLAALEREREEALQGMRLLTAIDPNVTYIAQLAPSIVRVLSTPTEPSRAEPNRAALIALLAAVVTAFAGVVVALLAEAVRAPNAARVNR